MASRQCSGRWAIRRSYLLWTTPTNAGASSNTVSSAAIAYSNKMSTEVEKSWPNMGALVLRKFVAHLYVKVDHHQRGVCRSRLDLIFGLKILHELLIDGIGSRQDSRDVWYRSGLVDGG